MGVSPVPVQMWAGRPHPHWGRPRPLRPRACSVLHPVPCECGPAGKRGGRGSPRWLGAPGAASATDDRVRRRDASRTRSRTHARTRSPTRAPPTDARAPGRAHVCASRECARTRSATRPRRRAPRVAAAGPGCVLLGVCTALVPSRDQRYDAAVAEGTLLKVTEMRLGKFRFSLCDERTPVLEVRGCRVLTGYSPGTQRAASPANRRP